MTTTTFVRILRRRCQVCGQKKPNTRKCWDFAKDTPEAWNFICRRCDWQIENRDKVAERQRRYREEKLRRKFAGIRTVRSVEERNTVLKAQYGRRTFQEALGIEAEAKK